MEAGRVAAMPSAAMAELGRSERQHNSAAMRRIMETRARERNIRATPEG
jgi:hypothetical protein